MSAEQGDADRHDEPAAEPKQRVRRRRRPFPRQPKLQKREASGRFAPSRARRAKHPRRSKAGRSGESRHARLDHKALVRALVVLEHKVGRLEAETDGRVWEDPEHEMRSNMGGIDKKRTAAVKARTTALAEVLKHFAGKRTDPNGQELCKAVATKLKASFSLSSLYREPYASMWLEAAAKRERHPADRSPLSKIRGRLNRRGIIYQIQRLEKRLPELLALRRSQLVAVSDAEGWEPIPDHPQPEGAEAAVAVTSRSKGTVH